VFLLGLLFSLLYLLPFLMHSHNHDFLLTFVLYKVCSLNKYLSKWEVLLLVIFPPPPCCVSSRRTTLESPPPPFCCVSSRRTTLESTPPFA